MCCRYCKEGENTVIEFKAALQKAEANCRLISETMLLKVERKRMYDHREFAAQQAEHHVKVCLPAPLTRSVYLWRPTCHSRTDSCRSNIYVGQLG